MSSEGDHGKLCRGKDVFWTYWTYTFLLPARVFCCLHLLLFYLLIHGLLPFPFTPLPFLIQSPTSTIPHQKLESFLFPVFLSQNVVIWLIYKYLQIVNSLKAGINTLLFLVSVQSLVSNRCLITAFQIGEQLIHHEN